MAETAVVPNNKAVVFRGKTEREAMPMESQAQNAAMRAAAEGKSTLGIPKKVGKKFVSASHGQKVGKLPKHVHAKARKMHAKGLISDKQMKKIEA